MAPKYSTSALALWLACLACVTSGSFLKLGIQKGSNDGGVERSFSGSGSSRLPSEPRVVISLTTVPAGVRGLGAVLASLRNQTVAADAIEVNLPGQSSRDLGKYMIQDLSDVDSTGVSVFRTDDWFALTNLVPTVRRAHLNNKKTLVIVVDDDKIYPPTLVEDHLRAHRKKPFSASTCRGYKMPPGGDIFRGRLFSAWDEKRHSIYGYNVISPQRVAVVTGSDSWSVPSYVFTSRLWDDLRSNASEVAYAAEMMNDIYASGQLSRLGVPKFVVPCRNHWKDAPKTPERQRQELNFRWPGERHKLTSRVMTFFADDWRREELMTLAELLSNRPAQPPKPSAATATATPVQRAGSKALLWAERLASTAAHTLR